MPIVGSFAGASARAYGLGAGGGLALDGFYQIATTTVGASAVSDITFTGIPSTYKHLQIRGIFISTADVDPQMRFNSDTSANYSSHALRGSGGSPTAQYLSGITTNIWFGAQNGTDTTKIMSRVVDILDYADTNKYKTVRIMNTSANNTTTESIELISGNWRSTSAITSIALTLNGSTWKQYTSVALYGITG